MDEIKHIEVAAIKKAAKVDTLQALADLRAEILGKKGSLGQILRGLGELSPEQRKQAGQNINESKERIEAALVQAHTRLEAAAEQQSLAEGRYDVSLPGRRTVRGSVHPLRQVETDILRALTGIGFVVAEGPLVEHDWYNFEALNIPKDHPARDMQDTFFLAPRVVLRTHTSNVQVRTMVKRKPPVRILAPGMVFRHDEVDPTHSPVFHQVEGLWVDDRATFADLKGVLRHLASHLFGPEARIRLRPSFFPFTEPSAEIDVSCVVCKGTGKIDAQACRICKQSGWLEILGAGMVDPEVLQAVGYDSEKVQGFAFGVGVERIAMLRYGIDDMRLLYENDLRFLHQFQPQVAIR